MSLNPLKAAPKETGGAVGSAVGFVISYFLKTPTEVTWAIVIIGTWVISYFFPERVNTDHAQDLSGGDR